MSLEEKNVEAIAHWHIGVQGNNRRKLLLFRQNIAYKKTAGYEVVSNTLCPSAPFRQNAEHDNAAHIL